MRISQFMLRVPLAASLVSLALTLVTPRIVAQATQPEAPPASAPTFRIILPHGVAPCALHVDATQVPLAHGTPLTARYEWDFGDPGGRFNTIPGWTAAHVYDLPGQYTLKLAITDDAGQRREFSKTLLIQPDTRRAIFVAANGSDAGGNGTDASRPLRTLPAAMKLLKPNTKVLLRRGDTFDVAATLQLNQPNVVLAAYAPAPAGSLPANPTTQPDGDDRPLVRYAGAKNGGPIIRVAGGAADVVVQDLVFDTAGVRGTGKEGTVDAISAGGTNFTVRNCRFLNLENALNANSKPHGVLMMDCDAPSVTGIRGYLAWVEGTDFVFLGNSCANTTREHVIRVGGADRINISFNHLDNLDRRSQGDRYDTSKGALTIHKGSYAYICGNVITHGTIGLGPLGQADGLKDPGGRWRWGVIEQNRLGSWLGLDHGLEHAMVRNNLIKRNEWAGFVIAGYDRTYNRGCVDITLANNTVINGAAKGNFVRLTGPADGVTLVNNLYVAPQLRAGSGGGDAAPVWVASDARSLSSFRVISHNVWPAPAASGTGVNYVGPASGGKASDCLSPRQWLQQPQVEDDLFEAVSLDDRFCPTADSTAASHGIPTPGVTIDLNGQPRPSRAITVGAVQCPAK